MRSLRGSLTAVLAIAAPALAQVHYDIGRNGENKINISWESRATVETIIGRTVQAEGLVKWEASDLSKSSISISVPVASFKTGIDLRDEHLRSSQWMDAAGYPEIRFQTTDIKPVEGKTDTYALTGTFTCHGVDKTRTLEAVIRLMPAQKGLEQYGYLGDIAHLQARFEVPLADHNIKIPANLAGVKVAPTVTCTVDIFAFTNNKPNR